MQLPILHTNIDMLYYITSPYMYSICNLVDRLKSILLPSYNPTTCRLSRELDMIVIVPIVVHELNGP
jgi:hypothetical protein